MRCSTVSLFLVAAVAVAVGTVGKEAMLKGVFHGLYRVVTNRCDTLCTDFAKTLNSSVEYKAYISVLKMNDDLTCSLPSWARLLPCLSDTDHVGARLAVGTALRLNKPAPQDPHPEWVTKGKAKAAWLKGPDASGTAMLYLHGGGFTVGDAESYMGAAVSFSRSVGASAGVLVCDYRRVPESSMTDMVDDVTQCWEMLKGLAPNARLVAAGDSAGGTLCMILAQKVTPAALLLISPGADFVGTVTKSEDPLLTLDFYGLLERYFKPAMEAAGGAMKYSPALWDYSELRPLPPVWLWSGGIDPINGSNFVLAEKISQASKKPFEHTHDPALFHIAPLLSGWFPEAAAAVAQAEAFLLNRVPF